MPIIDPSATVTLPVDSTRRAWLKATRFQHVILAAMSLTDEPLDGNEALPYWINGQKQALQGQCAE